MRVALVLPDLNGGGAERVALTLAEDLLAHGHEVDIVLTRFGGDLLPLIPSAATLFELKARRFRLALPPLVRYFRDRRPDATHVFMWPLTVVAIVAHRLSGRPGRLVVSEHTTLSSHYGGDKIAMAAVRSSTSLWYGTADARLCVSEGAAQDLVKISGLPRDKFVVIYNPVLPPDPIPMPSRQTRAMWPTAGPRILTVGNLKEAKNHPLLLRAFAKLAEHSPASLLIVGEGPMRGELEALADQLGISGRVRMPGFLADPWPMYAAADLFVLSSDYEGFGNVLLEAMFCGLPVVSTDCPNGPNEILDGGRYGHLVPVGNADELAEGINKGLSDQLPVHFVTQRADQLSRGALKAHRDALFGALL